EPLVEVLAELGVADPEGVSDLINAVVHASARALEAGKPIEQVVANLTAVIAPMADDLKNRARRCGPGMAADPTVRGRPWSPTLTHERTARQAAPAPIDPLGV